MFGKRAASEQTRLTATDLTSLDNKATTQKVQFVSGHQFRSQFLATGFYFQPWSVFEDTRQEDLLSPGVSRMLRGLFLPDGAPQGPTDLPPRRLTSSCPALPRDSSVSLALPLGTSLGGQSLASHDILLLSTASSGCSVNISEQINPRMKERGMARSGVCVGDEWESEPWGSRPSPWGVFRPQ